jgi:hypothetical protein
MKSNIINIAISCLFFTLTLKAQTTIDALRLAIPQQSGGTARSMGVGGAIGALGADYSAVGVNPAGLASYRTSELVFTAGYSDVKTDAILESQTTPNTNKVISDTKSKFYLNNFGLVGCRRSDGDWKTMNWTIGFNRLQTFDASFYFNGDGQGTIVNRFQEKANNNQGKLGGFEAALAAEAGAIYYKNGDNTRYTSDFEPYSTLPVTKSQQGSTTGKINEMVIGYAANYKEQIQIGATIGIPFMSFYDNKIYVEEDVETAKEFGRVPSFKALEFREDLGVTGRGLNAKIGVILKPFQSFRVGASLQTPNRYKMSEAYNTSFSYTYWEDTPSGAKEFTNEAKSPDGLQDYVIRTPWRYTLSAALLAGKKGFLSVDADFIDYRQMAFEYNVADKKAEIEINDEIKTNYAATMNLRIGAEVTYDIFRFRAGLATTGLPVKVENPDYWKDASKTYSVGAGLRERKFYFDIAYQFSRSSDVYSPYRVSIDYTQPSVARTQNNSQFIATLGFKF